MKTAHRRAHRLIWFPLALLLPAILVLAFVLKQTQNDIAPAIQIEPPSSEGQL